MKENERAVIEAAKKWAWSYKNERLYNDEIREKLSDAVRDLGSDPLSTDSDAKLAGWLECAEFLEKNFYQSTSEWMKAEARRRYGKPTNLGYGPAPSTKLDIRSSEKPTEEEEVGFDRDEAVTEQFNPQPEEAKPRMMRCPRWRTCSNMDCKEGRRREHPENQSCSMVSSCGVSCVPVSASPQSEADEVEKIMDGMVFYGLQDQQTMRMALHRLLARIRKLEARYG